jgi:hypothetical protein
VQDHETAFALTQGKICDLLIVNWAVREVQHIDERVLGRVDCVVVQPAPAPMQEVIRGYRHCTALLRHRSRSFEACCRRLALPAALAPDLKALAKAFINVRLDIINQAHRRISR